MSSVSTALLSDPREGTANDAVLGDSTFDQAGDDRSEVASSGSTAPALDPLSTDESSLSPLDIIYPEGLDSIVDGWTEILFTMDSGARDTVVGPKVCPEVETKDSRGSILGLKYEVVNGQTIKNEGQKYLYGYTDEGMTVGVTAQVA